MARYKFFIALCGGLACAPFGIKSSPPLKVLKQRKGNFIDILAEEDVKKPKVVIVGAGLTGCITSYLLRRTFGDTIDLSIFERSPYPSGRFGAGLRYKKEENDKFQSWCDMGSQVLSSLNCDGGHPNACTSGHGMEAQGMYYLFYV